MAEADITECLRASHGWMDPKVRHDAAAEIERLRAELLDAQEWTDSDQPLPEDREIDAAHPLHSRGGADYAEVHQIYSEALRMVGAKRSKYALVDLVNWLLRRIADLEPRPLLADANSAPADSRREESQEREADATARSDGATP